MNVVAVDDNSVNLMLLTSIAKTMGVEVKGFLCPAEALEYANGQACVDILLADYMMPKMNGIELITEMRQKHPDLVSIMITAAGEADATLKTDALKAGATDFLTKPLEVIEFKLRLQNQIELRKAKKAVDQNLEQREFETLNVLSTLAEFKDPETGSHINRVAHYSRLIGEQYGLGKGECNILFHASPLHDMGKVGIRDGVLLKQGKLTDKEFEEMKGHALIGYNILKNAKNPYLQAGAQICLSHHEKYNGKGYPNGLSGDDIPLYGRITAIADVFDALTSVRPYKRAWTFDEAMAYIETEKGQHFDPVLAQIFIDHRSEVERIYNTFQEVIEEPNVEQF